ncbi:MAG TPA: TonB-dependent receptor [Gammaproteobacteria bacterium]|nr:TonB-dependent receptor [Gammaproteobacteria bacterium]
MRSRAFFILALMASLVAHFQACGQDSPAYANRPVREVLEQLRARGAPLVYSTSLVPPTLRVDHEPQSTEPLEIAREVLAAHGLAIEQSGGAWLVVRGPSGAVAGTAASGAIALSVAGGGGAPVVDAVVQLDVPHGPSVAIAGGRAEFASVAAGKHLLSVSAPGFLAQRASVVVAAGATAEVSVVLPPVAPRLDEVTVTASRYDLRADAEPSTSHFTQQQIESLSYLGDDALRVAHRLPGVATNDFSARAHVRGGDVDEMTVMLDGMRINEPFHLRDYQAVFSAIDQRIVSGEQIYSGGFPAEYGDALSGLTVMDRVEPTERLHTELGLSLLYTSLLSSGTFADGRAQWLVSARRGNLDKLIDDERGEPSYQDEFVHVATALGAKHKLAFNAIGFGDDITLRPSNSSTDREEGVTDTSTRQLWITLDSEWRPDLSSRTLLYQTRFDTDRYGDVADLTEMVGVANDRRSLDESGVKQDWRWDASSRHLARFGFDVKSGAAHYDYASTVRWLGVLATLEPTPSRSFSAAPAPSGDTYAAYVSDRWRITDRLIADLGLRWDEQTYLPPGADEQVGPRASLLYRLDGQTDLRVAYGEFFQSQGLAELQIEDGVVDFAPAQRATSTIVGVDHRFPDGLALRAELFEKTTHDARPRYENLFDPLVLLPELRPGRVLVAPERGEARGGEVLLSATRPFSWWLGYSFARADDVIDGQNVPRSWDQRNALNAGVTHDVGPWTLSAVLNVHTGWPVTTLSLVPSNAPNAVDGVVAVPGPRNAERLDTMQRIDFRASRTYAVRAGSVRVFAEVTNLLGTENVCCLRYEQADTPLGSPPSLTVEPRNGLPFTVNIGALWQF